jgi:hypothetical protein
MNKERTTTHNIANKGFSGMRRFVARFNFPCNLIGKKHENPYCPYCQTLWATLRRHNNDRETRNIF